MIETIKKDFIEKYRHRVERLNHVYGVKNTAIKLGKIHGQDLEKITCIAYLHDLTKYEDHAFHRHWILKVYDETILNDFHEPLWHAFSAVAIAKLHYNISDVSILGAIESHTVGKADMSILEKIIFISDYIEPNRLYPSCVAVREAAFKDLDLAVHIAIKDSIDFYENTKGRVPSIAYQALKHYENGGKYAKN